MDALAWLTMGYKAAERVRDRVEGVVLDLRAFELVDTDRLIGAAWLSDLLLDRVGRSWCIDCNVRMGSMTDWSGAARVG